MDCCINGMSTINFTICNNSVCCQPNGAGDQLGVCKTTSDCCDPKASCVAAKGTCCRPHSMGCSTDSDCCTGTCGDAGTCASCAKTGAGCISPADCCSGTCSGVGYCL
jgi:hypothetical protein